MNNKKETVTRSKAKEDPELREEVQRFNVFSRDPKTFRTPRGKPIFSSAENLLDIETPDTIKTRAERPTFDLQGVKQNLFKTPLMQAAAPIPPAPLPNTINMSAALPLKDVLKFVPEFDGHKIPLSQFIDGCEDAKSMIDAASEANLTKLIRSKLIGEARQSIVGQNFTTIDALTNYLMSIYAPARTIPQLLGELGREYQKPGESVITFANRIRELGRRILETYRVARNEVTEQEQASTENAIIECFIRGLDEEIERRLTPAAQIGDLVREAINIERLLANKNAVRKQSKAGITGTKKVAACKICKSEGHETQNCKNKKECQYCRMQGHLEENCFKKARDIKASTVACQLCKKTGHEAKQCPTLNRNTLQCQYCSKTGHTAETCWKLKPQDNKQGITCQICKKTGHTAENCYQRGVQGQPSVSTKECLYCKNKGHEILECRKLRFAQQQKNAQGNSSESAKRVNPIDEVSRSKNLFESELLPRL